MYKNIKNVCSAVILRPKRPRLADFIFLFYLWLERCTRHASAIVVPRRG